MKKKRLIIAGIIGIIILCVGVGIVIAFNGKKSETKQLSLIFKDIKTVEYGSDFDSQNLVDQVVGTINDYPILDTKTVGKQILKFEVSEENNQQVFEYEIEVIDTQKPVIELKNEQVEMNLKAQFDALTYIKKVEDKVDGKIEYKKESDAKNGDVNYYTFHSTVNINKAGNYEVKYTVVDKNTNTSTKVLKVIVKEEKKSSVSQQPTQNTTSNKTTDSSQSSSAQTPTKPEPKQSDYTYVLPSTVANMKASQNKTKLVIVTSTSSQTTKGTLQYFVKQNGSWVEKLKTVCQLGKQGMGVGSEDSSRTPIGSYHFTHAYGILSNPGSLMSYTKINSNHYWCGDQYYNQFVDKSITDHSSCSIDKDEHLIDYPISYDYFASFSYNPSHIKGKGAAFFLHCIDSRYGSTGGCVAISKTNMIYILKNIDTSTGLVISQIKNIGNY